MSKPISVYFEASASGDVEIEESEVMGMTDEEIESYVYDGAEMLVQDQIGLSYKLVGIAGAIRQIKEAREDDGVTLELEQNDETV